MDILSRINKSEATNQFNKLFLERLSELLNPTVFNPSALNYGKFTSSLSIYFYSLIRDCIVYTLQTMDKIFLDKPGRVNRYYVKAYRKRELTTIFGHIIYKRHEYVDRISNKPYIYVDESIGLHRKDRFDPCVCSKIYEKYGYINSMIKVGKDIGTDIFAPFLIDDDYLKHSISRQTIWKILHRFKQINIETSSIDTPSTLYVMADEKYIACQNNNKTSLMVKEVIVHEGIKTYRSVNNLTGEAYIRNSLINPIRFLNYDEDIYSKVFDYINKTYNIDKINNIYLMGDGGTWIKQGLDYLKGYSYSIHYGLDKYHFCVAINTISKDDDIKNKLYSYSISNNKRKFNDLIEELKALNPSRNEMIIDKANYIINNFSAIKTMYKDIKIGCAMEQAISHDISAQFSNIPKAYAKKWLPFYLNLRQNYLNNFNLKKIYLKALDQTRNKSEENIANLVSHLDLSFFDSQIKEETYKLPKQATLAYIRGN